MNEPIIEKHFYLDDYADEIVPHEPTLEGCAQFLRHGKTQKDRDEGGWTIPDGPLVEDGATVSISSLVMVADRSLVKTVDGYAITPPIPEGFDFIAPRHGPGLGWSADEILEEDTEPWYEGHQPAGTILQQLVYQYEAEEWDGADLAVGKHCASAKYVFSNIEGQEPKLTPLWVSGADARPRH